MCMGVAKGVLGVGRPPNLKIEKIYASFKWENGALS